jgi:hypothetical protein
MRRLTLIAGLAALIAAGMTTTASAALKGGIGDQNASTFSDPNFQALRVKRTRLITPYDSIFKNPAGLDQWMSAVAAAGLEPLIAFNPTQGSHCPARPCALPTVAAYTRAFKAFRARYPGARLFNFWNETNSPTQPTGPLKVPVLKRVAALYKAALGVCGRSCTVTGPDILDLGFDQRGGQQRASKWVSMFVRFAGRYPLIWGFHNYGDTNYRRATGTTFFLKRLVRKGKVWVTETGGVVQFKTSTGKKTPLSKYDENRAARGVAFAYGLAKKFQSRIQRLYYYQWRKNNPGDFFDAGIVRFDGTLRPSYAALKKLPGSFWG